LGREFFRNCLNLACTSRAGMGLRYPAHYFRVLYRLSVDSKARLKILSFYFGCWTKWPIGLSLDLPKPFLDLDRPIRYMLPDHASIQV